MITSAAVARKLVSSQNSGIQQQGWGISKSGVALRISAGAPEVVEKGVALKVDEKSASHLTPLYAPDWTLLSVLRPCVGKGGKFNFHAPIGALVYLGVVVGRLVVVTGSVTKYYM